MGLNDFDYTGMLDRLFIKTSREFLPLPIYGIHRRYTLLSVTKKPSSMKRCLGKLSLLQMNTLLVKFGRIAILGALMSAPRPVTATNPV